MPSFYELDTLRGQLDAIIAEAEGVITPAQEAAFAALELDFDAKVERTALYRQEVLADAEGLKAEIARLADRMRGYQHTAQRLEALLLAELHSTGRDRVKGLRATVSLAANPPKVETVIAFDEADLRHWCREWPTLVRHDESWALDKDAVKAAAKAGTLPDDIAKCVRVTSTVGIRIR
jgi:hypothetical protein